MFKVGDWVRYIEDDIITRVDSEGFCQALNNNYNDDYELWKPQEGEWCWFRYNKGYPVVRPYDNILRQSYEDSLKNNHNPILEPFIGELPSFIKDANDKK